MLRIRFNLLRTGFRNEPPALGEIIAPSESASTGELIHAMHAFSHTKYDPTSPDWKQYLKALLEPDPRGQLRISRTRFGVRFVNAAYVHFDGESHDRQVIAELAVLGVPLNTPINIGKSTFLVEDLITDAEAMFQLHGEFEWAVIALFSYMPSRNKIVDRFGRVYTIEQLVECAVCQNTRNRIMCWYSCDSSIASIGTGEFATWFSN